MRPPGDARADCTRRPLGDGVVGPEGGLWERGEVMTGGCCGGPVTRGGPGRRSRPLKRGSQTISRAWAKPGVPPSRSLKGQEAGVGGSKCPEGLVLPNQRGVKRASSTNHSNAGSRTAAGADGRAQPRPHTHRQGDHREDRQAGTPRGQPAGLTDRGREPLDPHLYIVTVPYSAANTPLCPAVTGFSAQRGSLRCPYSRQSSVLRLLLCR